MLFRNQGTSKCILRQEIPYVSIIFSEMYSRSSLLVFLSFIHMASSSNVRETHIGQTDEIKYGNFVPMKGYILRGEAMITTVQENYVDCAFECIKTPGCYSYNYGNRSQSGNSAASCSLLATDHFKNASRLEPLSNYDYFYIAVNSIIIPAPVSAPRD